MSPDPRLVASLADALRADYPCICKPVLHRWRWTDRNLSDPSCCRRDLEANAADLEAVVADILAAFLADPRTVEWQAERLDDRTCQAPGPAWGHCGNAATHAIRRRDGTRGVGYWCALHVERWHPSHADALVITPLPPKVFP